MKCLVSLEEEGKVELDRHIEGHDKNENGNAYKPRDPRIVRCHWSQEGKPRMDSSSGSPMGTKNLDFLKKFLASGAMDRNNLLLFEYHVFGIFVIIALGN